MTMTILIAKTNTMITQRGFSLLELMVTLSVVAVLSTLALPSFTQMIKNNRLTTQANEFILALNFSRSEAVKRGVNVTIVQNTGGWANGWIVCMVCDNSTGDTLRIGDPLPGTLTLANSNASVIYQPSGAPTVAPGNFNLCDDRSNETGRQISISVTGRISVSDVSCS